MKAKALHRAAAGMALALMLAAGGSGAGVPAESADKLMAGIVAHQQTTGFTMRARLIIQPAAAAKPVTLQIRAVGKYDANRRRVLYQAIWPDQYKGRAVVVDKTVGQPIRGSFYTPPDTLTPITPARMGDSVLGSDLSVEDLAEDFQSWPGAVFAGQDKVSGAACRIVESRPPSGTPSSYALVRSCVSETRRLIMRVEKIAAGGRVVKRFTVAKTARAEDGVVAPRELVIETVERGSRTTVDVSRGERGLVVGTAEFSLARLKSLGR